jgi:hypothetical protein
MRTVTNVDSNFYCATLSDSSGLNNLKANPFFCFVPMVTGLFMTSQQQLSGGKNYTTLSVLSVVDLMQASLTGISALLGKFVVHIECFSG